MKERFLLVYSVFLLVAFASGFGSGFFGHGLQIQTKVVKKTVAPQSAAALEKAWGKPDLTIPGAQLNSGLNGATCVLYKRLHTIICS